MLNTTILKYWVYYIFCLYRTYPVYTRLISKDLRHTEEKEKVLAVQVQYGMSPA